MKPSITSVMVVLDHFVTYGLRLFFSALSVKGDGQIKPYTHKSRTRLYEKSKKLTTITYHSANENTVAAGKKTISPADVFKALDDTEFSFLKEPLEAEFASTSAYNLPKNTTPFHRNICCVPWRALHFS